MSNKKLGSESAYPFEHAKERVGPATTKWETNHGMSKRFYAACSIAQGFTANSHPELIRWKEEEIARYSYRLADELLRQENL